MIFVYDITNEESFKNVEGHFQDGSRYTKQALRFLVGNKADLIKKRVITESQGQELADSLGVPFTEVSAKSGQEVEETFTGIATMLLERLISFVFIYYSITMFIHSSFLELNVMTMILQVNQKRKRIKTNALFPNWF